jgi:hypothetical protein
MEVTYLSGENGIDERTTRAILGLAHVFEPGYTPLPSVVYCAVAGCHALATAPWHMTSAERVETRYTWAQLRDDTQPRRTRVPHLLADPIAEQRLTNCGDRIDGRACVVQEPGTRRCGRCEEAARTYLQGRISNP